MFFFIGGIQPKTVTVNKQERSCPICGHFEVYLKRVDHYVSLFFIPIFPVKKGTPFLFCENCNTIIDEHYDSMDINHLASGTRCPYCGRPVEPDFSFCPYCGKAL
jgi:RNA polymerase subunit RPABC4/transcription elongation factor Spt4